MNILNDFDLERPLYRWMNINKFKNLILNKSLVLPQILKFEDSWENLFLHSNLCHEGAVFRNIFTSECMYAQCWTQTKESDALWRIYSPDKKSVRIRVNTKVLWDNFTKAVNNAEESYIGKVKYLSKKGICNPELFSYVTHHPSSLAKTALVKRSEFKHENEVRLIFVNTSGRHIENKLFNFEVDTCNLIEEILLDPRAELEYINEISDFLKTAHFDLKPEFSKLYYTPSMTYNVYNL